MSATLCAVQSIGISTLLQSAPALDLFETTGRLLPTVVPPVIYCPADNARTLWPSDYVAPGPVVIWGWHVVRGCEGAVDVPVHPRVLTPRESLLLALAMEARPGGFSWREMAAAALFCKRFEIDVDGEISTAVTGDSGFLPRIRRYLNLPASHREWVARGSVDLRTAERLAGVEGGVLEPVVSVAEALSHSNRRSLLLMVRELLASGRLYAAELGRMAAETSEAAKSSGAPKKLLEEIRTMRFPGLCSMEKQLETFSRTHFRGSHVRLAAPPHFEGHRFSVQLDFADATEYAEGLSALRKAQDHLEDILGLL